MIDQMLVNDVLTVTYSILRKINIVFWVWVAVVGIVTILKTIADHK
jgi:hypothetical protein